MSGLAPQRNRRQQREMALDVEYQRQLVRNHRQQEHQRWVAQQQASARFDHHSSRVRADIIVNEARRLEREHLQHQLQYARDLVRYHKRKQLPRSSPAPTLSRNRTIGASDATPPPKSRRTFGERQCTNVDESMSPKHRTNGGSPAHAPDCRFGSPLSYRDRESSPQPPKRTCACLHAPMYRQITPKYRALTLLRQHFEDDKVEDTLETLRETYASDHDMLEDLAYRYGPEEEDVSPNTRLRCVEEKVAQCDEKWREIGRQVMDEMRYRDAFPNVIRNLSIMRIFLEGSQSPVYTCDTNERARRDSLHQQVLDKLAMERELFLPTPSQQEAA